MPLLICMYLQVDKLRVMFLEMKNEKAKLTVKFQSHVRISMPFQGHFLSPLASALPYFLFPISSVVLLSTGLLLPICFLEKHPGRESAAL